MDRNLLKTCIEALKELRERKHEELEASVVSELDAVILQLESCWSGCEVSAEVPADVRIRALNAVVECLKFATNLSELINKYFGPE